MNDSKGHPINRMDFVQDEAGTVYLVTVLQHDFLLWDFKAWLAGYYDAYVPVGKPTINSLSNPIAPEDLTIIGNLKDNPELLPEECEGYNGEPRIIKLGTVWEKKNG